jgi:hypothetical protein
LGVERPRLRSKTEMLRHYMVIQCGNKRHNPFFPPSLAFKATQHFSSKMSGTRKWKLPADYQRVQWTSRNTRRGVKNKQIVVFTQNSRSGPSTPSKRAMPTDDQQYFDGDPPEPLTFPTSKVYLLPISCLLLNDIDTLPRLRTTI